MEEPRTPPRPEKEGEIHVFWIRRDSVCFRCRSDLPSGSSLVLRGEQAFCLSCAGLAALVFLPSGDAALTRRAVKFSPTHAIVLKWSPRRKRYERQGTLVAADAEANARTQCLGDEEKRSKQREKAAVLRAVEDKEYLAVVTQALGRQFPGCPPEEIAIIAGHACEKHSGRVGRSAAMKELDPEPMRLAVIAHIRHVHTQYDNLLAHGVDKREARGMIQKKIQMVLGQWSRQP